MGKSKLTTRQWKLYQTLKISKDYWITQKILYGFVKKFYSPWRKKGDFHNSKARIEMTRDIAVINNDPTIQKIILSGRRGIKIANRDEYKEWSTLKWMAVSRLIKKLKNKDEKARLDGQMKLIFKPSEERDYYETFEK